MSAVVRRWIRRPRHGMRCEACGCWTQGEPRLQVDDGKHKVTMCRRCARKWYPDEQEPGR